MDGETRRLWLSKVGGLYYLWPFDPRKRSVLRDMELATLTGRDCRVIFGVVLNEGECKPIELTCWIAAK